MAETKPSHEEARSKAKQLINNGASVTEIRDTLLADGFSFPEANAIIAQLTAGDFGTKQDKNLSSLGDLSQNTGRKPKEYYTGGDNSERNTQVIIGVVIMVIGLAVSFFSYQAAANNPNGGTYVVAWGAVIFGAVRVFRALAS